MRNSQPKIRRRQVTTTHSDYEQPIFSHLAKGSVVDGLDHLSVTDIPSVAIAAGSVHAVILETWTRYAIGHSIDTGLTLPALNAAIERQKGQRGSIRARIAAGKTPPRDGGAARGLFLGGDGAMRRRGYAKLMASSDRVRGFWSSLPMTSRASLTTSTPSADCIPHSAISARNVRGPTGRQMVKSAVRPLSGGGASLHNIEGNASICAESDLDLRARPLSVEHQ